MDAQNRIQDQSEKMRALKNKLKNIQRQNIPIQEEKLETQDDFLGEESAQEEMTQQQELSPEQIQTIQLELQQIAKLQDNGIYRLEILKSQAKNQDILIDFGSTLFDKLEKINSNLSLIAAAIESYGVTNEEETN